VFFSHLSFIVLTSTILSTADENLFLIQSELGACEHQVENSWVMKSSLLSPNFFMYFFLFHLSVIIVAVSSYFKYFEPSHFI
jgi:hypothetical protein